MKAKQKSMENPKTGTNKTPEKIGNKKLIKNPVREKMICLRITIENNNIHE